jgi:hypothetical protein
VQRKVVMANHFTCSQCNLGPCILSMGSPDARPKICVLVGRAAWTDPALGMRPEIYKESPSTSTVGCNSGQEFYYKEGACVLTDAKRY